MVTDTAPKNRLQLLRQTAIDLKVPIAACVDAEDLRHLILMYWRLEGKVTKDYESCFAHLYDEKLSKCQECQFKSVCEQICAVTAGVNSTRFSSYLTRYGFERESRGQACVELLLLRPHTSKEITAFLQAKFNCTAQQAVDAWIGTKERLKSLGYPVKYDPITHLNTLSGEKVDASDK